MLVGHGLALHGRGAVASGFRATQGWLRAPKTSCALQISQLTPRCVELPVPEKVLLGEEEPALVKRRGVVGFPSALGLSIAIDLSASRQLFTWLLVTSLNTPVGFRELY